MTGTTVNVEEGRVRRRDFLKGVLASSLMAACGNAPRRTRVGLALGGGGAKGLAHVLMLEVFDELAIVPHRMAGTSVGSVIATLYAAGMSGREIRQQIDTLTVTGEETWIGSLFTEEVSRWFDFIELKLGKGALVDSTVFVEFLGKMTGCSDFSQLKIPLSVVAADFWAREQVVLDSGPLLPAVKASMAVPGLFEPVDLNGRLLVDGGLVNPVPYDLLTGECDIVVAIDVLGVRTPDGDRGPNFFELTFNSFQIMQEAIVREKLARHAPEIYIKPDIENVRLLDFYNVEKIYREAAPAARKLRSSLRINTRG